MLEKNVSERDNVMITKIILSIFAILILANSVYAFGVSYDPTPITMAAGETKTINLNLQNMVGDEDITAKVEIKEGSEIASLEKDTYLVKAKTYDTYAPIKITIPREEPKDSYTIVAEIKTVTPGTSGAVSMGIGTGATFSVTVLGEIKEKINIKIIIGLIVTLIIVILVIIFLKAKKRKKFKR